MIDGTSATVLSMSCRKSLSVWSNCAHRAMFHRQFRRHAVPQQGRNASNTHNLTSYSRHPASESAARAKKQLNIGTGTTPAVAVIPALVRSGSASARWCTAAPTGWSTGACRE
jgi:hypothetical protein